MTLSLLGLRQVFLELVTSSLEALLYLRIPGFEGLEIFLCRVDGHIAAYTIDSFLSTIRAVQASMSSTFTTTSRIAAVGLSLLVLRVQDGVV